jgi:hypothetical protein
MGSGRRRSAECLWLGEQTCDGQTHRNRKQARGSGRTSEIINREEAKRMKHAEKRRKEGRKRKTKKCRIQARNQNIPVQFHFQCAHTK